MTATVFGPIAAGIVTPDLPMPLSDLRDFHAAIAALGQNTDPDRARWAAGYVIGFMAGLSDDIELTDKVLDARNVRFAAAHTLPEAQARWGLLGTATEFLRRGEFMRACGVLDGWKRGTADRPDARTCGMCEARILTNREGVTCEHGTYCSEECERPIGEGRCPTFNQDPESGL